MASAVASHALYPKFTDVGFEGRLEIMEGCDHKWQVELSNVKDEDQEETSMEGVWRPDRKSDVIPLRHHQGSFRVLEHNSMNRLYTVSLEQIDSPSEHATEICLLEVEPKP